MAMTLDGQYSQAQDTIFVQRVTAAIVAEAQTISGEATSTANHTNRVALMKAVVTAPTIYAPVFALLLTTQQISQASTDTQIASTVATVWDTAAGVP